MVSNVVLTGSSCVLSSICSSSTARKVSTFASSLVSCTLPLVRIGFRLQPLLKGSRLSVYWPVRYCVTYCEVILERFVNAGILSILLLYSSHYCFCYLLASFVVVI